MRDMKDERDNHHIEGIYVEAVFVGHTHENHIFYNVDLSSLEGDDINDLYSPYLISNIYFDAVEADPEHGICSSQVYIETNTATKDG